VPNLESINNGFVFKSSTVPLKTTVKKSRT
jgi:hypothetical protein